MAEASCSNVRLKHSKETNGDRISDLPDAVLCEILSFLTTNETVGTSLLSSRWRYVWTGVPILHFEEEYGVVLRDEFVDRVMNLHRVPYLKKFYLRLSERHDPSHVNAWICAAVLRNVEELHLFMNYKMRIKVPQILYHCCEKLVVLKLSHLNVPNVLASVCFPSLKILHIQYLNVTSISEFVKKILSGCPVLEDFKSDDCRHYQGTLCIHSSSLKKLTIKMNARLASLDIIAPKLEVLNLQCKNIANIMMKLLSLVEADIHVEKCFVKLQSLISNVKVLRLTLHCFEDFFDPSNCNFITFGNLIHLDVTPIRNGWLTLPTLLNCSPNLEVLVVDLATYGEEEISWFSQEDVPRCMLLCLKVIEFHCLTGFEKEMEMIEYFLKNSMVLEEMVILSTCYQKEEMEKMDNDVKRLLMFPKASRKCQIVLVP